MNRLNQYFRKGTVLNLVLLIPIFLVAQDAKSKTISGPMDWVFDNMLFLTIGAIVLLIILAYSSFHNKMIDLQLKDLMIERGDWVEPVHEEKVALWKKLYDKAWDLVPIEKEADIDLGHDFDGIRELDNRLPPWWLYMFYGTIIWGIAYVYVSHYSEYSQTQAEEYVAAMEVAEQERIKYLANQKNLVDETNVVALIDPADLEAGMGIYNYNCVSCHGMQGEGGVGPNLTDPNWIHGGGIKNIFKRIKYGIPDMGMIAWKSQLQPKAIQQVASYVLTLEGTNPPNAKEPQGDIYVAPAEESDDLSMNIE